MARSSRRATFDEALAGGRDPAGELVLLDDALEALARLDNRKSQVVELRFFRRPGDG